MRRAVFLDRDGVINRPVVREGLPYPPASAAEFALAPGVAEACRQLRAAGFLLVVVTNQPDVGRGTQSREEVERIHARMLAEVAVDRVEVCFDGEDSPRRKPAPGMILDAARELGIDVGASYMVGDRWRDIDCGKAAGCATILIEQDYAEGLRARPDGRARDLAEAARQITALEQLRVRIFADGADLEAVRRLARDPLIAGITTNPTLLRKAGVTDYAGFAREVLAAAGRKPVSFEVLSAEPGRMRREAMEIDAWGPNVWVKIPVVDPAGHGMEELIGELARAGVKVNVTAITTVEQVRRVAAVLERDVPAVVSVFAGRIADTGRDPVPVMREARRVLSSLPRAELLWASVREVRNLFDADGCGCDIVTVPHEILAKARQTVGADPEAVSVETVRMFARDAAAAGLVI